MAPVYRADVRQQFDRLKFWAREAGLDTTQWQLHEASGPIGWKLVIPGEPGKMLPGLGRDWLGNTPREAESALRYMTAAFRILVTDAAEREGAAPEPSKEPT